MQGRFINQNLQQFILKGTGSIYEQWICYISKIIEVGIFVIYIMKPIDYKHVCSIDLHTIVFIKNIFCGGRFCAS